MSTIFADTLRNLRKANKMSQAALAQLLFVSPQAIGKWERCEASPNPETIAKIANIFEVTTDYLLNHSDPNVNYHFPHQHIPSEFLRKPNHLDNKKPPVSEDNGQFAPAGVCEETRLAMELLSRLNPENHEKALDHLEYLLAKQADAEGKK